MPDYIYIYIYIYVCVCVDLCKIYLPIPINIDVLLYEWGCFVTVCEYEVNRFNLRTLGNCTLSIYHQELM